LGGQRDIGSDAFDVDAGLSLGALQDRAAVFE
jgi:hypothetical protein